jgi:hypothetical protein
MFEGRLSCLPEKGLLYLIVLNGGVSVGRKLYRSLALATVAEQSLV